MTKYRANVDFETYGDSPKEPRQVKKGEVLELNDKQVEILGDKVSVVGEGESSPSNAPADVEVNDTREEGTVTPRATDADTNSQA